MALDLDAGHAEHLWKLIARYRERPGAGTIAGGWLRIGGRASGMERDIAFDLRHDLMNMAVQYGHEVIKDIVKFQTFKTGALVTRTANIAKYQKDLAATGKFQFNMLKKLELNRVEHEKLMRSIKLMGEKVIPELRDLTPPKSLTDNALRSDALEAKSGSFTVTGEKLKDS